MASYTVAHRYRSYRDGQAFGPWAVGEVVELTQADAVWVCRDSPGALVAVEVKSVRAAVPKADRQARGGRNRSG